jgi:hypothetical protein
VSGKDGVGRPTVTHRLFSSTPGNEEYLIPTPLTLLALNRDVVIFQVNTLAAGLRTTKRLKNRRAKTADGESEGACRRVSIKRTTPAPAGVLW